MLFKIGDKIVLKKKRNKNMASIWEGVVDSYKGENYMIRITDADQWTKLTTRVFSKEFIEENYEGE